MQRVRATSELTVGLAAAMVVCLAGCPSAPQARFGGSVRSGEAPLTVRFVDMSWPRGSAITSWQWSFGDGGASEKQSPTHTYAAPGDYEVRLRVVNANGSDTLVSPGYIHVRETALEDSDRVGIVFASGDVRVEDETEPGFMSTAILAPGSIEQLASLGYLAGGVAGAEMAGVHFVEALPADSERVLSEAEFMEWLGGDYDEFDDSSLGFPLSVPGLDAGDAGSVGAASQSRVLTRWEDTDGFPYTGDVPALAYGVYAQESSILSATTPAAATFAWPGGADVAAATADMNLPASLTMLSPFAFEPGDPLWEPAPIERIDTTEALSLTWEPSGAGGAFLQFVLMIRAGDADVTVLLCKAVDDGAYTIPASVMAQLPEEPSYGNYRQEILISRLRSEDVNVPLAGSGGFGKLRMTASTAPYTGTYAGTKASPPLLTGPRPFLSLLRRSPR